MLRYVENGEVVVYEGGDQAAEGRPHQYRLRHGCRTCQGNPSRPLLMRAE